MTSEHLGRSGVGVVVCNGMGTAFSGFQEQDILPLFGVVAIPRAVCLIVQKQY